LREVNNTRGDKLLKRTEELVTEELNKVTASNWSGFCKRVVSLRNECRVQDGVLQDATDSFITKVGTIGSDVQFSEWSNHDQFDEDSDSDKAQPLA
jgi:hypothetical protein